MTDTDSIWAQRHITAFRYHRGHQCTVEGCTGNQPLMWVPTEAEDREVAALEAEVTALSRRAQDALNRPRRPRAPGHIHWAMLSPDTPSTFGRL